MKTYQLAIHAIVGGCIRCRVGSVSVSSRTYTSHPAPYTPPYKCM